MPISLTNDELGRAVQVGALGDVQSINFGATATTIANVVQSNVIRVVSTFDCHIRSGALATAATTDTLIPANTPEYFSIEQSVALVSVIAASGATDVLGTLYVTEA